MSANERFHTVVIGGGQAGLAAAYFLKHYGMNFVVLDSSSRVGDAWRKRWDSLRLFTPAKFSHLPGLPFPADDFYFPTKNEMAGYLENYAGEFHLPVRLNTAVKTLAHKDGRYTITTDRDALDAENVIVATGAYQCPVVPSCSRDVDPSIMQMHSSEYRTIRQLPEGTILVVGAGNSGSEIAIEAAQNGRQVWLSGNDVGRIPADRVGKILGGKPYWFFISHVLSLKTPIGRKVQKKSSEHGTPYLRLKPSDVTGAGVARCSRVTGVKEGKPMLQDGQVLDVAGIVWATGYRCDFSWIHLPVFDQRGLPVHEGGRVLDAEGLYFVGLHFQRALTSALIGGVGTDARRIVQEIHSRDRKRISVTSPTA